MIETDGDQKACIYFEGQNEFILNCLHNHRALLFLHYYQEVRAHPVSQTFTHMLKNLSSTQFSNILSQFHPSDPSDSPAAPAGRSSQAVRVRRLFRDLPGIISTQSLTAGQGG